MPWTVLEHTADVGLSVTADTLEQALGDLVEGFGALVCPEGSVEVTEHREMTIEADALDDLVVDALDELNFVHQIEGFIPATCSVQLDEDGPRATFELAGERYDPDRHGHLMEIKATTFHGLKIQSDPVLVEVIFDV